MAKMKGKAAQHNTATDKKIAQHNTRRYNITQGNQKRQDGTTTQDKERQIVKRGKTRQDKTRQARQSFFDTEYVVCTRVPTYD
jgi:hypothetical protein